MDERSSHAVGDRARAFGRDHTNGVMPAHAPKFQTAGMPQTSVALDAHVPPPLQPWWEDANRLDVAVYAAIAATPTPAMDVVLRRLSHAADRSGLWLGCAAVLAAFGGRRGRAAAADGLASIALTSSVVNLALKPLGDRRRPDRHTLAVPLARQVAMPRSSSWPSGHSASAFAFATGVGAAWPAAGVPLSAVAALVAYSRVHTGVHYPSDTIVGAVTGVALAPVAVAGLRRWQKRRR
jgi:membrane-associated phospholipid phosphatase